MIHELKIAPKYFEGIISGRKTFVVRKDDRNYQENDVIILKEYVNDAYTGKKYAVIVTYILRGDFCKDGYCIMGIKEDKFRNALWIIKESGYIFKVIEDNEQRVILFYNNDNEEKIIYGISFSKTNLDKFIIPLGSIHKRYGLTYSYMMDDITKDNIIKGIKEETNLILSDFSSEYQNSFFYNVDEIINDFILKAGYSYAEKI